MSDTIICKRCKQPAPRRTYATVRCVPCEQIFQDERMAPFRSTCAAAAAAPMRAVESTAVPTQAVANAPETEYRSDTERKYADHLAAMKALGEIVSWRYEPIRFRLAEKTTYTPDFQVILPSGAIEFHETKFTWKDRRNDASRVKIKMAAELYREFRFVGMIHNDGVWEREEFAG